MTPPVEPGEAHGHQPEWRPSGWALVRLPLVIVLALMAWVWERTV